MKPGVRVTLVFCKSRCIRTAIASSSMRHLVDYNLGETGLTEYFDAVVTGRDVANGKPSPDIFLLAAERIGVPTSDCVVFEDAFTGICAAHAAGCRSVLIPDRRAPQPEILELISRISLELSHLPEIVHSRWRSPKELSIRGMSLTIFVRKNA